MLRRRREEVLYLLLWLFICGTVLEADEARAAPLELWGGLAASTVAVALIRRAPLVSLIVAASTSVVVLFRYEQFTPAWPFILMVPIGYLAGRLMAQAKPALLGLLGVSLAGVPVSLAVGRYQLSDWAVMTASILFAALFPWLLGRYFRMRELLARAGWERAEELETNQEIVADQARLRERARIASDMHDSLGHELSLIAVRAAALEVAGGLDAPQRTEAAALRESAATATERLREIIGVLRDDVESAPTEPHDGSITELVDRARSSGLVIKSEVDEAVDAPPMVERAAYRVVQESLTNAAKHAPGAAVTVRVSRSADETLVSVRNEDPPAGPLPGLSSGKRGLVGLRERVRLVGGTLRAGPGADGFEVLATLPHHGSPAADSPVTDAERTESTRRLEQARRQVRRSLIHAVLVPALLFAGVLGISGVIYAYNFFSSQLPPADFDRLPIGQPRAEFAAVLPAQQAYVRPSPPYPPPPPGSTCEFYGTDSTIFSLGFDAYRLCFVDGRLASKELIQNREASEGDPGTARG
ncbi:sensor histidine kinase [Amycolatopsis nigrescens]|uniref:sensor histidine kinase n=1 Tax=Amycolatopsis nigrescens TaxID=381445 RepID=UPI00037E6F72|nr:histidine kinase [Amycolatopsis nigrescens]